ncbi:MAG: hypothetical protein AUH81_18845 [Candidatus Rokubacteria bacterium 13_1_40CM_4_69_5]|nr:MAG: hypothetical protein AUH81_18845 [Candidatus Rokubacteria bacterium 13_1_40CM_4_69_5]
MRRLYLIAGGDEIARRRPLLPAGSVIEAWADLYTPGLVWVSEESKALLDSVGEPLSARLTLPGEGVPVYYGPQLRDIDSLPPEDSLRTRVLSAHGIAVAWITLDRFGQRTTYQPQTPTDPAFHLRRRGGGPRHLWQLFSTKREAMTYMAESYGHDSEAVEWAESLTVEDFDSLLKRHADR